MKIGSIDLGERPVFLAPMEDVTDISFRLMCKSFGADMVYTEFVSSDALIRSVNKTQQKLNVSDDERPVAIQIYGKDVASMVEAARICEEARPDILDITWLPRKESSGQGSRGRHATQYPVDAGNHERSSESREHPRHRENPFRMGCDNRVIVDLAEQLQDCGIAALSIHDVHGRKCTSGEADWTLIRCR